MVNIPSGNRHRRTLIYNFFLRISIANNDVIHNNRLRLVYAKSIFLAHT